MKGTQFLFTGILLIVLVSGQVLSANGANILGLFTSPSPSHLVVHIQMAKLLAQRGHNVTIVVAYEPKVDHKGIKVIIVPPTEEQEKIIQQGIQNMSQQKSGITNIVKHFLGTFKNFVDMQAVALKDPRFQAFYNNPDNKFDLVLLGWFMNSYQLGVAAKFNAPVIATWLSATMSMTNRFTGNPTGSSYVPGFNMALKAGEKMSFLQRMQNLFSNTLFDGIMRLLDIRMRYFYK